MKLHRQLALPFSVLLGTATMACGQGENFGAGAELAKLRRENHALRDSLVAANKREKEQSERLKEIRLRLEAMGASVLEGGDKRLVSAVQDLEVLSRKLRELENAAMALSASTQEYLGTAIAADPEARMEVETRLRDLEMVIGLREKPQRDRQLGNLQQASVVSVDGESGIVVVNVGEKESAVIGMPFEVFRNEERIAEAIVAQTRPDVSALVITNLENDSNPVRRGDRVSFQRK